MTRKRFTKEHYRETTHIEQERLALNKYRFLLATHPVPADVPPNKQEANDGIALIPSDHPLVEIVAHLGYQVCLSASPPRYRLLQDQHLIASGEQLADAVMALLKTHKQHEPLADHTPTTEAQNHDKQKVSLMELMDSLPHQDLELTCVLPLPVRLQLYHPHAPMYPDQTTPALERGYRLEIKIPPAPDRTHPFTGGDSYLLAEVVYPSWEEAPLTLEDIIRACGLDPTTRIWSVRHLEEE
jgi:hypothetical protein